MELFEQVRQRDPSAIARVLTWVDNRSEAGREFLRASLAVEPCSIRVGITGAPGVGKSTLTAALIAAIRSSGSTVAVLAVDPSSSRTGGALLGDRIRMAGSESDAGVFVRRRRSG
jgi:LAO/AO transport system kinase